MHRLLVLTALVALLAGCAPSRDIYREQLTTLPQRHARFDLLLAWETKVVGLETVIEGVAKNVRYPIMNELEIWVAALDPQGRVVARNVSYVLPRFLQLDEIAPFSLKLPIQAAPGTKLLFTYKYRAIEGGEDRRGGILGLDTGGTNWLQSFETVVPETR